MLPVALRCSLRKRKNLIQQLERQHVQVQIHRCDVSDARAVAAAIDQCSKELGPIRGAIQCAMVLRDSLFASMTHRQWVESTRPKIQGSWNLHQLLPADLDFFITLSSFTAIFGSRGQTNYSAGGAYEDAMAYYRRAQGRRATTVDLGIMLEVGVLAEIGMTDAFRQWEKPYGIREKEFLALVERVIDRETADNSYPQIVTGVATGGSVEAAGISRPYYFDDARFSVMARTGIRENGLSAAADDAIATHTRISQAKTFQEATEVVLGAFMGQISKMVQTPLSEVDPGRSLHSFGIDSSLPSKL